jgi:hypothetical protein
MPTTALNLTTRSTESLSHESALSMIPLSYDSAVFERLFEKRTSRRIRDICENIEGYESVAQGEMIDEKKTEFENLARPSITRVSHMHSYIPPPLLSPYLLLQGANYLYIFWRQTRTSEVNSSFKRSL